LFSFFILGLELNQYNWTISDAALENVTLATKWSDLEKILMKSTTPKLNPNNFVLNSRPRHWDDLSKFDKDDYLLKRHGPKHMEKSVAVGMTIFYGSLFLLGVPGNFLTCLIIFMNSYMRAAPNYYLFNLAVADILTLSIGKLYFISAFFDRELS
jgi:hypothetical protein